MPKAFSQHERELIEQELLKQGYKLFSAHGLRKTNVEEIAKAAGISKGAFYSFYESKEALFLEVIESAETRVRQEVLAVIDRPGPSPRARFLAVLKKAFALFAQIPILQFLTGGDYDLLFRRVSPEQLKEHVTSDRAFFEELISHCQNAGIPIQAQPEQIIDLLYPLALSILHQDDVIRRIFSGSLDLHLELIAAFCLGEIEVQLQGPIDAAADPVEGSLG
jgi:AcrR family transcriptional regulator